MAGSLDGKVAIVTGGTSGIGRATALAMTREGARVVVSGLNRERGEQTVTQAKANGGVAIFVQADVSQAGEVEDTVRQAVEAFGKLDCAFNNAGTGTAGIVPPGTPMHEFPENAWDRVLDVNLKGVWLSMKYEIPALLQQGGGAIVNTASVLGLVGATGNAAYSASKHGVVGLTQTAALAYARQGIRVNAVCPGYLRTALTERILSDPEREARTIALHPFGRLGTPEEIAEAVVWLCSEAASFVTGIAMPVDGGYLAQ